MKILQIFLVLCSLVLILNADSKYKTKHSYRNLDYLNLSQTQTERIRSILLELKSDYKEFYKYKDKLEDEIEDIIEKANFDEELYINKMIELKTKATLLEAKRIKKIHEILDKKQRDKFADHFKEWIIE